MPRKLHRRLFSEFCRDGESLQSLQQHTGLQIQALCLQNSCWTRSHQLQWMPPGVVEHCCWKEQRAHWPFRGGILMKKPVVRSLRRSGSNVSGPVPSGTLKGSLLLSLTVKLRKSGSDLVMSPLTNDEE